MNKQISFLLTILLFSISLTWAGGYEKNVVWSGRYSGIAGAATSNVEGPESLFFNPAGLADSRNIDLSVNASPTWSKFKAPYYTDNIESQSKNSLSPIFSVTGAYKFNEDFGIGAGYFASGGSNVDYGAQDYSATHGYTALKPEYKTRIAITEFSTGAGYKFTPAISVGIAWRMTFVDAEYKIGKMSATSLSSIQYTGLKDTQYSGFRVGIKYTPEDKPYGFGVNMRTSVKFKAEGDVTGNVSTVLAKSEFTSLTGSKASMQSHFPMQVAVGAHYDFTQTFRVLSEYVWSQYSENKTIKATGKLTVPTTGTISNGLIAGATLLSDNPNAVIQRWKDQHNVRLAAECSSLPWALRAGYVFTTAVVRKEYATATFSSPAAAHTVTLGTGSKFLDDYLSFDVALEHSWAKGKVNHTHTSSNFKGKYETSAYSLHTGVGYIF